MAGEKAGLTVKSQGRIWRNICMVGVTVSAVASPYKKASIPVSWSIDSPRHFSRRVEAVAVPRFNMKNTSRAQAVGVPVQSIRYAAEMCGKSAVVTELKRLCLQPTSYESSQYKQKADAPVDWMRKFSKKADGYLKGIKDHVSLGPKISETVKGKLSLGAKILRAGGVERVFRKNFSVERGEKLLQAFQCYLSTTAGPIAGLLFISTHKIAFRSDRSIRVTSPRGNLVRVPYKVLIPVGRVRRASLCENSQKPNQKYIQIVTVDEFEFWFMGFLSYQRSLNYLRRVISKSQVGVLQ